MQAQSHLTAFRGMFPLRRVLAVGRGQSKVDAFCDFARDMGLDDLAELPAQPCLSSRVETGLAIDADVLTLVDRVERRLTDLLGPGDIRCRVTRQGLRIELPPDRIDAFRPFDRRLLEAEIVAAGHRLASVKPYVKGSAFLQNMARGTAP